MEKEEDFKTQEEEEGKKTRMKQDDGVRKERKGRERRKKKKQRTEGDVCVFMLQQCEPQLCDPLTLGETLSVVEDDQLKEEAHNDTQLHAGTVCVRVRSYRFHILLTDFNGSKSLFTSRVACERIVANVAARQRQL